MSGKVALVTGAGQGIGRALALGLAAEGYAVAAADLNETGAVETAQLASNKGGQAFGLSVNVGEPESVARLIETVIQRLGSLDVLVNNAGIFPREPILEMEVASWDRVIQVNLRGSFLCAQAAARTMVSAGRGGRIVSMASRAAFQPYPRGAHYAASKAGIVALTRTLALELAPHSITVNALAPGLTNTSLPRRGAAEEQVLANARSVPLGRMAEPEDMVPALLFLCGAGGSYITGQVIHVNGGSLMP